MTEFIFKIKNFSILLLLSFTNAKAEEINCNRTSSDTTGFKKLFGHGGLVSKDYNS